MFAISSRHGSLKLLAGVVVAQLLLLAVQIKRENQVRLIRVWAVELISPVQRAGAWAVRGIENGWGGYVGLRHTKQQNQILQAELNQLKIENIELESRAREADRLASLLHFRQDHEATPMLAARVIGASPDTGSLMVYIDRGSRDGVRKNMGVITPDGVVGKVLSAYPDTSQVLLLGDKESGVGAMLADTRAQGAVVGTGDPTLSMDFVSKDDKVTRGEAVVTSGQDRIFPKDLPVGTVIRATSNPKSAFMRIDVRPAAHLDRLEEVLVLLTRKDFDWSKQTETEAAAPPPAKPPAANPSEAAKTAAGLP